MKINKNGDLFLDFKIALSVKKHIEGFYICKKYHGRMLHRIEKFSPFRHDKYSITLRKFAELKYDKNYVFVGYKMRKCYLVERSHVLEYLEKPPNAYRYTETPHVYQFLNAHLTGTSLYLFYDNNVPFWKIPEFRPKESWLPEDIEEYHISNKLKNRDEAIKFLNYIKEKYK